MRNGFCGQKVLVLGCSGGGKSTFAKKLAERTGLPLFHLDNLWWKADRTHISRAEFDQKLREILETDQWIVDGDYSRTYETRIRACDTIFVLDYPEDVCRSGIEERIGTKRTDIPWIEQQPDPQLIELVNRYRTTTRPKLRALLDQYPEKECVLFPDRSKADAWLEALRVSNERNIGNGTEQRNENGIL